MQDLFWKFCKKNDQFSEVKDDALDRLATNLADEFAQTLRAE